MKLHGCNDPAIDCCRITLQRRQRAPRSCSAPTQRTTSLIFTCRTEPRESFKRHVNPRPTAGELLRLLTCLLRELRENPFKSSNGLRISLENVSSRFSIVLGIALKHRLEIQPVVLVSLIPNSSLVCTRRKYCGKHYIRMLDFILQFVSKTGLYCQNYRLHREMSEMHSSECYLP